MKKLLFLLSAVLFVFGLAAQEYQPQRFISEDSDLTKDDSLNPKINHIISGYVTFFDGTSYVPYQGVTLTFNPDFGTATTDAEGFYTKEVIRTWTGTVTPFYCCDLYVFTPGSRSYTNLKSDSLNQNYTFVASQLLTISGNFTDSITGAPLANKTIVMRAKNGPLNKIQVTTNAQGEYSLQFLPCWSGTFDPEYAPTSNSYYYITPLTRTYTNITTHYPDHNYKVYNYNFGTPPGWQKPPPYFSVMTISVWNTSRPDICGVALNVGDLIGGFYVDDSGELKCGGYGIWSPEKNTAVVLQGDDTYTTQKEGFDPNETINWMFYSWENADDDFYVTFTRRPLPNSVAPDKWVSGGLSAIDSLSGFCRHHIDLNAGWSGLSSYQVPAITSVTSLFSPIVNDMVILQTLTGTYWPSQGTNTIVSWSRTKGYKIKMSNPADFTIPGCLGTTRNLTLSTGWNLFPVLSECNVNLTDVFNPVINKVTIIKDVAGTAVFWPSMGIYTLQVLQPGKAYLGKFTSSTSITYPTCTGDEKNTTRNMPELNNLTPWNDPPANSSSHIIALPVHCSHQLQEGDFLGAFTQNGLCAGITSISNLDENIVLTVYGDDEIFTENEGFDSGESMTFKLYRPSSGQEYGIWVEWDNSMPNNSGTFQPDGLSAIKKVEISSH